MNMGLKQGLKVELNGKKYGGESLTKVFLKNFGLRGQIDGA